MKARPTLKDVGAAAGVSVYVASRALRDGSGVADATRKRVLKVADELGYVRNEMAAGLKTSSSHTVGILTAGGRNQYYSMLAQAIDDTLQENGYYAMTTDLASERVGSSGTEARSVRMLLEQRPAAIVCTYAMGAESLRIIESFRVPVVFVDTPPTDGDPYPFVGSDNRQIGRLAARRLADAGHRSALILAFPHIWRTFDDRIRGFSDAAASRGMEVRVVEAEGNDPDSAYTALLEETATGMPEAVFALNTMMALGAFRLLKERGVAIGRDLSLIAVDDFDWAPLLSPALTVVAQDMDGIGRQAGRFVLDAIGGEGLDGQRLTIGASLIERESCVPRRPSDEGQGGADPGRR